MSITDDIRAAKRQRQFHSARDFETSSSQIGEVDDPCDDIKRKARLVIAGNSADADDAALLMQMLGVYPGQDFDPTAPTMVPQSPNMRYRR